MQQRIPAETPEGDSGPAHKTGWMDAHLRVRNGYPLVSVRYSQLDSNGRSAADWSEEAILPISAYAAGLARAIAAEGQVPRRILVEAVASPPRLGDQAAIELQVWVDGSGLDEVGLRRIAVAVVQERIARAELGLAGQPTVVARLLASSPAAPRADDAPQPVPHSPGAHDPDNQRDSRLASPRPKSRSIVREPVQADNSKLKALNALRPPRPAMRIRPPRLRLRVPQLPLHGWRLALASAAVAVLAVSVVVLATWPGAASEPATSGGLPAATKQPSAPTAVTQPTFGPPSELAGTGHSATAVALAEPEAAGAQPTRAAPSTPLPAVPTPLPIEPASAPRTLVDFSAQAAAPADWPNDPASTAWFGPDGYHLLARQPGQFVAVGVLADRHLRDVVLTATFHKTGGPAGGGYGLIVRDQGPGPRDGLNQRGRFLVVEVGDRGDVGMWRRDDDQWIDLLPWMPSAAVHPLNADNSLAVKLVGDQMTLSVNGSEVAMRTDATFQDGGAGVFVGGDNNQAVLTRLTLQATD